MNVVFFIMMGISLIFLGIYFVRVTDGTVVLKESLAELMLYSVIFVISGVGVVAVTLYPPIVTTEFKDYTDYTTISSETVGNVEKLTREINNNCLITTNRDSMIIAWEYEPVLDYIKNTTCEEYKQKLKGEMK